MILTLKTIVFDVRASMLFPTLFTTHLTNHTAIHPEEGVLGYFPRFFPYPHPISEREHSALRMALVGISVQRRLPFAMMVLPWFPLHS